MAVTSPRPRYGGSKVRTGCLTCKSRHVKCDEAWPRCRRCVSGGRQCGGYVSLSQDRSASRNLVIINYVPSVAQSPNPLPRLELYERRSLEYFRSRTAMELMGTLHADLWSKLMIQIAYQESAIRHAVIALAAVHELFETADDSQAIVSEFAMQQYGKAIQQVVQLNKSASAQAVDTALITCILFSAFESLQGHYRSALTHISSGVKVLAEQENEDARLPFRYVPGSIIRDIYHQLDRQSIAIGDENFAPNLENLENLEKRQQLPCPKSFSRLDEAHNSLDAYLNRLVRLLPAAAKVAQLESVGPIHEAIAEEKKYLFQYFEDWCQSFDEARFPSSEPTSLVLQIYRRIVHIMQRMNFHLGETAWDQFTSDFAELVNLAEAFVSQSPLLPHRQQKSRSSKSPEYAAHGTSTSSDRSSSADSSPQTLISHSTWNLTGTNVQTLAPSPPLHIKPTFSLSLGIITPLYITASRCRDPITRRRAVHLLSICNRKEGIWDSTLCARVLRRIIEVEEAGAILHAGNGECVMEAGQIPEHARIRELSPLFGAERFGRLQYRMSNGASESAKEYFEETLRW